jgi:microcystin-dependent protein
MSTPYVGEIRLFGFTRVPSGWLPCNGALQPISQFEVLYSLIGTTYGGDGVSTFATPNLSSRVPIHYGNGPGLSPRPLGMVAGSEAVTLISNQMPRHDHPMVATTSPANSAKISQTAELGALANDTMYTANTDGLASATTSPSSTSFAGSSGAHDNLMPTLTVQFCIAYDGLYPSQG